MAIFSTAHKIQLWFMRQKYKVRSFHCYNFCLYSHVDRFPKNRSSALYLIIALKKQFESLGGNSLSPRSPLPCPDGLKHSCPAQPDHCRRTQRAILQLLSWHPRRVSISPFGMRAHANWLTRLPYSFRPSVLKT